MSESLCSKSILNFMFRIRNHFSLSKYNLINIIRDIYNKKDCSKLLLCTKEFVNRYICEWNNNYKISFNNNELTINTKININIEETTSCLIPAALVTPTRSGLSTIIVKESILKEFIHLKK